ncbi:MAG TPA: tetratricopeptide repeat protein, partial [Elusimicrobiales bacterium]|nr:tetratricopeptide repeat protein [Elusimicrobiales bacterium]
RILDLMLERGLLPADALSLKGVLSLRAGEVKDAIDQFSRAILIDPKDCRLYNNRGRAYEQAGDFIRAAQDYSAALSIKPDYGVALLNQARLAEHMSVAGRVISK